MKTKLIFYLLSVCSLLLIGTLSANSITLFNSTDIMLAGNDVPFERPNGPEKGHRSAPIAIPISALLSDNHSIELDFFEPVGEVEIIISQDGAIIYSSSENIESSVVKGISLPQDLSGSCLLEIKGSNGAYAYGMFNLN